MRIEIDLNLLTKDNFLFKRVLRDKRVLSNSAVYIIEEYFPNLNILYTDKGIALIRDDSGRRFKVFCSSSGKFIINQSCTKGAGRDSSMGSWNRLVADNSIDGAILVDTSVAGRMVLRFVLNKDLGEVMTFD